jgi:hypothetical protein
MTIQMFPDKMAGSKLVDLNFRKKISPNDDMFPIISMNLEGETLVRFAENYLSQKKLAQLNTIQKVDKNVTSNEPPKTGKFNDGNATNWRNRSGNYANGPYNNKGYNPMMKASNYNHRNYDNQNQQNSQDRYNYQQNQRGPPRDSFSQNRQFGRQHQERSYADNRQRQNNIRLCHACQSADHVVRECPLMNRNNVSCYSCNSEGHYARDCPNRN